MSANDYRGEIVWIIGASSGIGAALARALAERGAVLALSARRGEALEAVRAPLGSQHKIFPLDVTEPATVLQTAQAIQADFGRIDRIIFLAAAYTPMKLDALDHGITQTIIAVNLTAAFSIVQAAMKVFATQPTRGQLALCGSVAGYTGLPGGQPYSATKAAIVNLAESLYAEKQQDFDIKLISPGFVRTPLTARNNFAMPMIISPEAAATAIADGLRQSRFEIHFPKRFTILLKLLRLLPYALALRLTRSLKA